MIAPKGLISTMRKPRKPTQAKGIIDRLMLDIQIDKARSNKDRNTAEAHAQAERIRKHVALMRSNRNDYLIEFHRSEFARMVGATGVAVYGHLIVRSCGKPYAFPSVRQMAKDLGMDKRTVRKALRRLMKYGLILRTPLTPIIAQALGIKYRDRKYKERGWLFWLNDWPMWAWDDTESGFPKRLARILKRRKPRA